MKEILTAIGIIAVLFVSVQYAEANEMNLMIEGENDDHGIFIAIEGRSNILMWDTVDGYSEHFDGNLKIYKSGNFSLKNPASGIAVWAHAIENATQYKLLILTSEGVERIVANVIDEDFPIEEDIPIEEVQKDAPTTIYPKSSVGADITKYDVPIISRDDGKTSMLLTLKIDRPNSFIHEDRYDMNGELYDARTGKVLVDGKVTVQISRDGYVIRELSDTSNKAGKVRLQFENLSYPEFYPGFCYEVMADLVYENMTSTWKDDFNISNVRAGTLDYSWLDQTQWNYLPSSFRDIPPQNLTSDTHCNGI